MKKQMKRALAVFLSFVMVLSVLGLDKVMVNASAAGSATVTAQDIVVSANEASGLGKEKLWDLSYVQAVYDGGQSANHDLRVTIDEAKLAKIKKDIGNKLIGDYDMGYYFDDTNLDIHGSTTAKIIVRGKAHDQNNGTGRITMGANDLMITEEKYDELVAADSSLNALRDYIKQESGLIVINCGNYVDIADAVVDSGAEILTQLKTNPTNVNLKYTDPDTGTICSFDIMIRVSTGTPKQNLVSGILSAESVTAGESISVGKVLDNYYNSVPLTADNMTFQWQKKGTDGIWTNITGATDKTLDTTGLGGQSIRCEITGQGKYYESTVYVGITPSQDPNADNGMTVVPGSKIPLKSAELSSETPKVGDNISVTKVVDNNGNTVNPDQLVYKWVSSTDGTVWTEIPGSTNSPSCTIPESIIGSNIKCEITPTVGNPIYEGSVVAYADSNAGNDGENGNPTPDKGAGPVKPLALKDATLNTETVKVGDTVSVVKVTDEKKADVDLADVTYQWQYKDTDNKWKTIDGATDKSLVVPADVEKKNIRCEVTAKTGTKYTGTVYAFADDNDSNGNNKQEPNPTDPTGPNKSEDGGIGPVGPKNTTPTPTKKELDTATLDNVDPEVGTPIKVDKITDKNGDEVPKDDVDYKWQKKDETGKWIDIPDSNKDTYVPDEDDIGSNIRVEIVPKDKDKYEDTPIYAYTDKDGKGGKTPDDGIGPVKPDSTPTPTKKELDTATLDNVDPEVGTPIKVDKITDKNGDEVPKDDVDYKWQKTDKDGNWVDIPDSNKDTYVPGADDIGSNIRVEITPKDKDKYDDAKIYAYTDKDGKGGTSPDKGVGPVKNPDPVVTDKTDGSITIEADPDKEYQIVDKDGNVVVDWTEDGSAKDKDGNKTNGKITFDGLDANTSYTVVSRVKGDANKNNWAKTTATTSPKGVVPLKDAGLNTTAPGLGTSVTVATLTDKNGKPVVIDDKNATYQWQVSTDGKTWTDITGATAASYVMSSKEIGKMIRCAVTGKGDYSGTVYTAATKKVSAEADIPTIVMNKELGYKKKFQIMKLNTKGAIVTYYTANKKYVTVNKKGIITGKKVTKAGKPVKVVFNITKGAHQVQYVTNVRVTKKVKKNYSLVKYKTKYKDPSIALYKLLYVKSKYTIKLKHMDGATATYKSSNKKIATVSKKGVVKGKKKGTADITITVKKNGVTYKYFVKCRVCKRGKVKNDTKYLKVIK